jgi:homoserine O-succinyltransferase/O-acetyltransferase
MPINISDKIPAIEILKKEFVFVMPESSAKKQDIRPLRIALLNIMPLKINTETQFLRLLSNTPLQIELDLIYPETHISKNTPGNHLKSFYKTFSEIKNNKYDGLIVTGAPVEHLPFEEVDYWKEMTAIFEWAKTNVTSSIFICWASQAALYYYYGINKFTADKKIFGVFNHKVLTRKYPIVRGFDDYFLAPHSRYTYLKREDIIAEKKIELIAESDEAGIYLIVSKDNKSIFIPGHAEYDRFTLKQEYERDLQKKIKIELPQDYFPENNANNEPNFQWSGHANLLFSNWINYYVYQQTKY